jgi:ABC-2 type transport system permease protein
MISILKKEFNSFLNSLIAYIVISVFLTGMGLLMWVFPDTSVFEYGYADMDTFFSFAPYVFLFLIPAITMRSFAEEKKSGTLELLFTKPLSDWQIIIGKFLACWLLVILALLPSILYYFSIVQLGNPQGNIDTAAVLGSYVGLIMLAAVFTATGILASSLTVNQIVAFISGVFLCFLFYNGFDAAASLNMSASAALFVKQLGLLYHFDSAAKGLIDTRDLIYFLSVTAVLLLGTKIILASRQW